MSDILDTLFHSLPNAIMSGLMIVIICYWLLSFLGIGFDDMDFDFDLGAGAGASADIGVDTEIDVEGDIDTDSPDSSGDGLFVSFLKFINVGKVPFMMVFSTLIFFIWMGSLLSTELFPLDGWGWKSVLILIPLFIGGVFFTRYATRPLISLLKKIGYHGEEEIDFLGRSGKMLSTIKGTKLGSAEFVIDKNPMKLTVISENGNEIEYGDPVIIMNENDDKTVFYVTREYRID